jgi:hypothetical protein
MRSEIEIGDHGCRAACGQPATVASGAGLGPSAPIGLQAEAGEAADHEPSLGTNEPMPPASEPFPGDGEQDRPLAACPQGQMASVDPAVIAELVEQWRRRQAWHRAEKSLTLQAKALCRRLCAGDKAAAEKVFAAAYGKGEHDLADIAFAATFPLVEARDGVARHRALVEKRLVKLAKSLPVAPYVESVRGVGLASLAAIVGEAGDLSHYSTVAKLWKRLGLAVMPDGTRQRRIGGDAAIEHGYSPARRSVMWNVGACIVKAGGPLKDVYDARKAYEAERVATKGHAHNRAQRYVEKRFARDLWVAWRRAEGTTIEPAPPDVGVSPSAN